MRLIRSRASRSAPVESLENRTLLSVNTLAHLPFQGHPQGVPGTIEFENYDTGGEGVSYHDLDPQNQGGQYRRDGVDIAQTSDTGGGYFVGWVNPGEWLNYTVNVATTTTYAVDFRIACGDQGGTFHVSVDGVNRTGPIRLSNTGG